MVDGWSVSGWLVWPVVGLLVVGSTVGWMVVRWSVVGLSAVGWMVDGWSVVGSMVDGWSVVGSMVVRWSVVGSMVDGSIDTDVLQITSVIILTFGLCILKLSISMHEIKMQSSRVNVFRFAKSS